MQVGSIATPNKYSLENQGDSSPFDFFKKINASQNIVAENHRGSPDNFRSDHFARDIAPSRDLLSK